MVHSAWQRVDSLILVLVRVAVGLAVFKWADQFLVGDNYREIFVDARFLFKYPGLEWIQLWPGDAMGWHFVLTRVFAIGLVIGLLTRLCAACLCFAVAYVLLVECQIYVNHYYLLSCAAGMLVFLPAGNRWSVDACLGIQSVQRTFWRWQLWLLRFQLAIPYFFGALAKLNGDWFAGQPGELILRVRTAWIPGGPVSRWPGALEVFVYGGFLYDLMIVPLLLFRRTRWVAVGLSLFFHLNNAWMLDIGVFPWFMLATLVVFFPPDTLQRRLDLFLGRSTLTKPTDGESLAKETKLAVSVPSWSSISSLSRLGFALATLYVIVQLLLPLRPAILPGDSNWNEHGHRFAWRMMLRHKEALTHYLVVDQDSDDYLFLPSTTVLSGYQAQRADHHPELIRQTAVQISKAAAELGVPNNRVYALALVALNGRKPIALVDPTVDLSRVRPSDWTSDWITPDPGPFLDPPWLVPKERWWQELELPEPFKPLQGRTPSELQEYLEAMDQESG